MFKVNGLPVIANDLQIIVELKQQLAINGINLFSQIKESESNIQITCPIHNNGQERNPSCGISKKDQIKDGNMIEAGTVHCFSCGYTATLSQMISHCFGKDDYGLFGTKWLTKNFQVVVIEDRKPISLDFMRDTMIKIKEDYIQEDELDKYRFFHPYMFKRKLTDEIIYLFDVGYDDNFILYNSKGSPNGKFKCLTFPVRDIMGNCLFIARRSVDTKLFHYPSESLKPVYGLYELMQKYNDDEIKQIELIITESIINALTCWSYGYPAVALLGLGSSYQYKQLLDIPCRKYITGFDGDKAGHYATEKFRKYVGKYKLTTSYDIPQGKDINDLTKNEFEKLVEFL